MLKKSNVPPDGQDSSHAQGSSRTQDSSHEQADAGSPHKKRRRSRLRIPPALGVVLVFALLLALFLVGFSIYRERSENWLSSDDALHIALNDAETSEGLIYDVSVRLCSGDPMIYAVGFKDYTGEYYYEMDAKTGVILEKSKPSS